MCGIAGLWSFGGGDAGALRATARAMTDRIAYRGPDGEGAWTDEAAGIVLGHRRLAIIDLTESGYQPMASASGRFVITYNGELFNAAEMAAELAVPLRGTSDTEVLVEAIARYGIDGALERANGMFAFAVFDRAERVLHLARDRLGVKPLYWTRQKGQFAFASELKALRAVEGLAFDIDPEAVALYLRHGCVPAPHSIFSGIRKLMPGERAEVSAGAERAVTYWNLRQVALDGQRDADRRGGGEIADELDALLADAVSHQMVSDVPLGAFLSGGIDSSTVTALMCKAARGPVRTFSIGFREQAYNEADDARAVARHLGTEHTELELAASDALAIVPELPSIYDEPFADSSQLPTVLLARLARRHVTVALSGDGGDECFAGYVRHQAVARLWGGMRVVPAPARALAGQALRCLSPDGWNRIAAVLPRRLRPRHFGGKLHKTADVLAARSPAGLYRGLVSQWPDPQAVLSGVDEPAGWSERMAEVAGLDLVSQMRFADMAGYMPDDVLTKVDRASMAAGLEVRVPLLDHRVVEFAWRLPASALIAGGEGKRPLRAVLSRYVPRALTDRPKSGFGVPVADWLRGPLDAWAGDLLSDGVLCGGLLDSTVVRRRLQEHRTGQRDWHAALWPVLQLQAWTRAWT